MIEKNQKYLFYNKKMHTIFNVDILKLENVGLYQFFLYIFLTEI